jgi:hypothetical protein
MKQIALTFLTVITLGTLASAQTKKSKTKVKKTTTVTKTTKVTPTTNSKEINTITKETIIAKDVTPIAPDQVKAQTQDIAQVDAFISFDKEEHNFGNVPEGPQAITEFKIKNISNEPITVNNVQASCGCTVPEWTKEPIAPGETGKIKAIYNTQGRPGNISKSLTVTTSKGTKTLSLKGNVEKAPQTSVPASENSMIKTN